MITVIVAGIALLVLVAIVVGVVDATQAAAWRQVAAERRSQWEAKQPQLHGFDSHVAPHEFDDLDDLDDDESWDDD